MPIVPGFVSSFSAEAPASIFQPPTSSLTFLTSCHHRKNRSVHRDGHNCEITVYNNPSVFLFHSWGVNVSRIVGRRGPTDTGWHWCVVDDPPRRRSRPWITAVPIAALAGILVFAASMSGGGGGAAGKPDSCGDVGLSVNGALTGEISFCASAGTVVSEVAGVIAVHYPGNENPCGYLPEPGPGDGWFQVPGSYQLALSGGPPVPGPVTSADWSYSFGGSFSLCGGENSMRVTIAVITNLPGAAAWATDFGPGAYAVRTESFKPEVLVPPTPTPAPTRTPTPLVTPTPSPSPSPTASPTPSPAPAGSPSPAPSATPSPAATPTPTPIITASPSPTPSASPTPTAITATPTRTPSPTRSPAVLERSATPVRSPVPSLPATGGSSGGSTVLWLFLLLGAGLVIAGVIALAASRGRKGRDSG